MFLVLFVIGLVALYSANGGVEGDTEEVGKHLAWFGIGIVLMIFLMAIDYEVLGKLWIPLYALMLLALFLVLFTTPIQGATSWFTIGSSISIQPSEFSKIIIIIGLAKIITWVKEKSKINNVLYLFLIFLYIAVPILLIIKQPDYGTAMVILALSAIMIFSSGISLWYVLGSVITVAVSLPFIYLYILPEHAKARINVFLNPQSDPLDTGYNIIQSMLAVGSGQVWGMGLFNGNQTQLGYLPMKTTDFIFSVIGEEMGFVMSMTIVVLFVLLIIRSFYIAKNAKGTFGALLATGIGSMLLAHFIENVGMTIGLMPITGIPLPFISYGGSSMLTNCMAIGILLSINRKRKKKMFLE
ncbi:MAG: rod shape-determining protein RodA [Clostridia bacterium]|nr:rod shape-determining protein RodA [Clostridia bacterium]